MKKTLDPFRFVLIAVAGWMNQLQEQVIDYLREENRVLREQVGDQRLSQSQGAGAQTVGGQAGGTAPHIYNITEGHLAGHNAAGSPRLTRLA